MIPIFDLHCHPSLKIYLCNHNIMHVHHPVANNVLPSGMQVDLPGMAEAGVKIICSYHHIPEAGLLELSKSHKLVRLLERLKIRMLEKFEKDEPGDGCMEKVRESIRLLNGQIDMAAEQFDVTIVRNLAEFELAFAAGKTIVIHCMEGAHPLGRKLPHPDDYVQNLLELKAAGLCILTLAHFFENGLCDSAGGIPPSVSKKIGYSRVFVDPGGLTDAGKAVIHVCQEQGMLIDLTHSTNKTREEVYQLLDERKRAGQKIRPILFTHTGVREITDAHIQDPNDRLLLPDRDELLKIKEYGGVLGMILMNYWTNGIEEDDPLKYEVGIPYVIRTIRFIAEVTGSFDHIGIGSDLDGLSQTPDDVTHVRFMGRLSNAIFNEFGHVAAAKICHENALRVLRAGWH